MIARTSVSSHVAIVRETVSHLNVAGPSNDPAALVSLAEAREIES